MSHPLTPIPFADPWEYEIRIPRDPRGPGIARAALRAALTAHGLGELLGRAELLTSELATSRTTLSAWLLRGAGSPGRQAVTSASLMIRQVRRRGLLGRRKTWRR